MILYRLKCKKGHEFEAWGPVALDRPDPADVLDTFTCLEGSAATGKPRAAETP